MSIDTYVDKNDPWTGILAVVAFEIFSKTDSRQKGCSPCQLIFGHDIIISINKRWIKKLIRQKKQA